MADKLAALVLGSTGVLGTKIVKALLDKGEAQVRAMIRPGSYDKHSEDIDAMKAKGAIIIEGDSIEPDTLLSVCEGVDVVVSAIVLTFLPSAIKIEGVAQL